MGAWERMKEREARLSEIETRWAPQFVRPGAMGHVSTLIVNGAVWPLLSDAWGPLMHTSDVEAIRESYLPMAFGPDDVAWLIAEVRRLREKAGDCADCEPGCHCENDE